MIKHLYTRQFNSGNTSIKTNIYIPDSLTQGIQGIETNIYIPDSLTLGIQGIETNIYIPDSLTQGIQALKQTFIYQTVKLREYKH